MDERLLALLWCPGDRAALTVDAGAGRGGDAGDTTPAADVVCTACGRRYPYRAGVLSFLAPDDLDEVTRREQASRDAEAAWYDTIFAEYTNVVEVPATVERIGRPDGPVLDHGAGTGRITAYLARELGQPVLAVDYSREALHLLARHCRGLAVLAVHADARCLPVRDGVVAAATSAEVYEHFRAPDRRVVLDELARVLRPGAPLSISSLNYSWVFRLWRLVGNRAAKEGEHLFGGDFYYVRQTPAELRAELGAVFDVDEVVGIRNIPARTLAAALGRVVGDALADRFLGWMTRRGQRADRAVERTAVSPLTGFFLLARAVRRS